MTITGVRKDVTAKRYGGDISRKNKLLDKLKKGKARMPGVWQCEHPAGSLHRGAADGGGVTKALRMQMIWVGLMAMIRDGGI